MAWSSWYPFTLRITDAIIREQAQALVDTGMKAAGYEYVVMDGGWELVRCGSLWHIKSRLPLVTK